MNNKRGLRALSPLIILIILIILFTRYSVDKSNSEPNLSMSVAFLISSIYAIVITGGMPIRARIDTYSKGAGSSNIMLMLWIY
ncbi:MAG: Na+/H+ antiporter NhaC family protein, partial [Prevotella sp.]